MKHGAKAQVGGDVGENLEPSGRDRPGMPRELETAQHFQSQGEALCVRKERPVASDQCHAGDSTHCHPMMGLPFGERVLTSTRQALCWHVNIKIKPGKNATVFYVR